MSRWNVEDEPPPRPPDWVVTYGDLMSLLMAFFVLWCSVSEIKEDNKYDSMTNAIRKQFGERTAQAASGDAGGKARAASLLTTALGRAQRAAALQYPPGTPGGTIYFHGKSSKLSSEQKNILQAVAREIGVGTKIIDIVGTLPPTGTDAQLPGRAPSELTFSRCLETMHYLAALGIDARRLRVVVAGEEEASLSHADAEEQNGAIGIRLAAPNENLADRPAESRPIKWR
jgi:chemotaxis protein MotB